MQYLQMKTVKEESIIKLTMKHSDAMIKQDIKP
jgi:hypothetical protein